MRCIRRVGVRCGSGVLGFVSSVGLRRCLTCTTLRGVWLRVAWTRIGWTTWWAFANHVIGALTVSLSGQNLSA
jgi:hypothetical protein